MLHGIVYQKRLKELKQKDIMAYERIMGLHVTDDEEYDKYRTAMTPILHSVGGSFGYDFKIAEVLASKSDNEINRVFTIEFQSKQVMDDFFSNAEYLVIQERHLVNSVRSKTVIRMGDI